MSRQGSQSGSQEGVEISRMAHRVLTELWEVEARLEAWEERGFVLRDLRIRPPTGGRVEWLGVVRAYQDDGRVVGFCSAGSFDACLHLVCARLLNGSMKWKVDEYD